MNLQTEKILHLSKICPKTAAPECELSCVLKSLQVLGHLKHFRKVCTTKVKVKLKM